MSYTNEQLEYINYNKHNHTKLIACAGSGKTRCIIARMNKLIENKVYKAESILMLTFSRFTRDDFINKIKTYNDTFININYITTIDKFAKQIIDINGSIDVSLLSYKFMLFLQDSSIENLQENVYLKDIKIIFIDEAQDLNEIQYKIFCLLRDKLGILINMIGDPNQNIYQFRNSSDKYLREFGAIIFKLTINFRSYLPIINFSKYLRPFDEDDIICAKNNDLSKDLSKDFKPVLMFHEDENILEDNIIDLLYLAKSRGIDYSEFAILSPTRGRMGGGGNSHGLCFISNILYKAKIKFKQFYEESTDEVSGEGIKYMPKKGHVNILTYMGSKGLEWNYVIIVGADKCLINKRSFNKEKHNNDRYLLYVACSRAITNMYIYSKCVYRNGEYHFMTNPWLNIPSKYYQIDDRFSDNFFFPSLNFKTYTDRNNRLSKIIDKFDCYTLDDISNLLDFENRTIKSQHKIFKNDYSKIEKPSGIFLSKYAEALFQVLYNIKMNRKYIPFPDIETIINSNNIVTGLTDDTIEWYNNNKKSMTWGKFDECKTVPTHIKQGINVAFDRKKIFNTHIIIPNGYYQHFIIEQKIWIKNLYNKYTKCKDTSQIRELLFYLIVIKHSIDTQHYFHIKSKGKKFNHILSDFKNMFDEIETYVDNINHNFIIKNEFVERWDIIAFIDGSIDDSGKIWTIKCTNEISLKHTIYSIFVSLMYDTQNINEEFDIDNNNIDIDINFINFMKGYEICYNYKLSTHDIRKLINIMQKNINNSE